MHLCDLVLWLLAGPMVGLRALDAGLVLVHAFRERSDPFSWRWRRTGGRGSVGLSDYAAVPGSDLLDLGASWSA